MKKKLENLLQDWPKRFIREDDLELLLKKSDDARYAIIKRAFKAGLLIRLKKSLYLIASKVKDVLPHEFELALLIYGPSFVSLESALSYHEWIPEAVYTTTCVSPKRAKEFKTPIGLFSYKHVPAQGFYIGVKRIISDGGVLLVAQPWRAVADFIYTRRKLWKSIAAIEADLRVDSQTLLNSDKKLLKVLCKDYPSLRVRKSLEVFLHEIMKQ